MRTPEQEPTRSPSATGDWMEEHPAYGMVNIRHEGGSSGTMFGSALAHNPAFVTLQVYDGVVRVHTAGVDRYEAPLVPLVEIRMTFVQWAELLSTPNRGKGTPVTIHGAREGDGRWAYRPQIQPPHDQTEGAEAVRTAARRGAALAARVAETREEVAKLLAAAKVSQKVRQEVSRILISQETDLSCNMPYYLTLLREAGERIASQVRAESEAAVAAISTRLGLARMQDDAARQRILEARMEEHAKRVTDAEPKP